MLIGHAQITDNSYPGLGFTAFYLITSLIFVWRKKAWSVKLTVWSIIVSATLTLIICPIKTTDGTFALTPILIYSPSIAWGVWELWPRSKPQMKIETFGFFLVVQGTIVDFATPILRSFPGFTEVPIIGGAGWTDALVYMPGLCISIFACFRLGMRNPNT